MCVVVIERRLRKLTATSLYTQGPRVHIRVLSPSDAHHHFDVRSWSIPGEVHLSAADRSQPAVHRRGE